MPKLKPSTVKKQNDIIYANIMSRCAYLGYRTDKAASIKIGMAISTFNDRKIKGNWRSNELVHAAEVLKVSPTWFWEDHTIVEGVR